MQETVLDEKRLFSQEPKRNEELARHERCTGSVTCLVIGSVSYMTASGDHHKP